MSHFFLKAPQISRSNQAAFILGDHTKKVPTVPLPLANCPCPARM